jgi:hypothetical protein
MGWEGSGVNLKNISKIISRQELSEMTNQLLAGEYGDPTADKLMDDYLNLKRWNIEVLRILIKRIYYLGMLEGTRRIQKDGRNVIYKRHKDAP